MADIEDRLRRLAVRREKEGIYTDAKLVEQAADQLTRIPRMQAELNRLTKELAVKEQRIAVLEASIAQLHGPLSLAALTARAERAEAALAEKDKALETLIEQCIQISKDVIAEQYKKPGYKENLHTYSMISEGAGEVKKRIETLRAARKAMGGSDNG